VRNAVNYEMGKMWKEAVVACFKVNAKCMEARNI
jgi:hypothetical protein